MTRKIAELALQNALENGKALLKFISPNDAGITGAHQAGFYLPKAAWKMYTPHGPERGRLYKHNIEITWPDARITNSVITWYGQKTRSEYRLTRFGKGFPWLSANNVGDLLVLIPESLHKFNAFVVRTDDEIETLLTGLSVPAFEQWGLYWPSAEEVRNIDECIQNQFVSYVSHLKRFPTGDEITLTTLKALKACRSDFERMMADEALLIGYQTEYSLFKSVERAFVGSVLKKPFWDLEDFLKTASQIMNRRKARAGRALENHVHNVFSSAGVPHDMRPKIDGRPDIVVPSTKAYKNENFPQEKLFVIGIKTTCKDRWRQVLNEGRRADRKYILTLQPTISSAQLSEMENSGVSLIVPRSLHKSYPRHSIKIFGIQEFIHFLSQET